MKGKCEILFDAQPGHTIVTPAQTNGDEETQYILICPRYEYLEPGSTIKPMESLNAAIGIALHSYEQAMALSNILAKAAESLPTTNEYYKKHPERFYVEENKNE